jgi:hypothetical protein
MTFISDRQSLEQAYHQIDELFDGWFSSRKDYRLDQLAKFFPNVVEFKPITLFAGMYWIFLNFPIDYLYEKTTKIAGRKLFLQLNLVKVDCVLKQMGLSLNKRAAILDELTQESFYANPDWKDNVDQTDLYNIKPVDQVIQKYSKLHPFGKVRSWIDKRTRLPKSLIEGDRQMCLELSLALTHVENIKERELAEKQDLLEKEQEELLAQNQKLAERDRLMGQAPSFLFFSVPGTPVETVVKEDFIPYDAKKWGY